MTICIFAMCSAGIYGFVDMANDVKKGSMIQYDRGENESVIVADGAASFAKKHTHRIETIKDTPVVELEIKSDNNFVSKKQAKVKVQKIITPTVIEEPVVSTELKSDVKVDSMPVVVVEDHIDYREFSRGAPRKVKTKKSKKD